MRRRSLAITLAGAAACLVAATAPDPAARLSAATRLWLGTLDDAQLTEATFAAGDEERFDLRLAPILLEGLPREEMSEAQWSRVEALLDSVLSPDGLRKVETIMSLEDEVLERDRASFFGRLWGPFIHGSGRYHVAVFGEPGAEAAWGLRVDGHHLSLNLTALPDGAVRVTPLFLGAEPRVVPPGSARAGLRALEAEEDLARALREAMTPDQQAVATLPLELASGPAGANRPLFVGAGESVSPPPPVGLAYADMQQQQRDLLLALIETWLGNFSPDIAAAHRAAIFSTPRDTIHFAWAGNGVPGEPSYYRIQGERFLIEWDDTVEAADHVHTVWRSFDGDFGRDLLAEHWAREHGLSWARQSPARAQTQRAALSPRPCC